jgi:hypothetical protein
VIGGLLQVVSAGLFIAAGAEAEVLMFPAAATAIASLWAWGHGRQREQLPPPPPDPAAQIAARLARMEQALAASQEELAKLSEDRDFYQQLYAGARQRTGAE